VDRLGRAAAANSEVPTWLADFPHARLQNDHGVVWVTLPDAERGFNRATRFDRSAAVVYIESASGARYFGPTTGEDPHNPVVDDHVAGIAGEFGMDRPWGYDRAQPGETFIKIGVGSLERLDEKPYFFRQTYPVADAGAWAVVRDPQSVTTTHRLDDGVGRGYLLETTIELLDDELGFAVDRQLTNLGAEPLATTHYSHNFFILNDEPPGPAYRLAFRDLHRLPPDASLPDGVAYDGRRVSIPPLSGTQSVWMSLNPPAELLGQALPWSFELRHVGTPASIRVEQSPPPGRVVVYARDPAFSVEPFTELRLMPGETLGWRAVYRFH